MYLWSLSDALPLINPPHVLLPVVDDLTPEEQMMSVGSFMRHLIQKQVKQIELRGEELILELEAEARKKKRAFISAQGE
jgi:hypothetical protein